MVSIKRDTNSIPVISGVLNSDGVTPTMVQIDPTTHILSVSDGTTGTVNASANACRDENSVPTKLAFASDGSGTVELAVDSSGNLLIQTT